MDKEEIIRRLKRLAEHAVNVAGEPPYFILSLDDGIALHEAIRLLNEPEPVLSHEDADGVPHCGFCGWVQSWGCNYCDHCGKPLRWE